MSRMHRVLKGCLLAALLMASPWSLADREYAEEDDRYAERERERGRGDRRYEDSHDYGGRDCTRDRGRDRYDGWDCGDSYPVDRYDTPDYIGQPTRSARGRYTDRYGTPEYIGQPSRGTAYDGIGTGRREIDRGRSSYRNVQPYRGGGRR